MGIENFKKEDLVGRSLGRLLDAIDDLSKEGTEESYQKLQGFISELSNVVSNVKLEPDAELVVTKADGSKIMEIRKQQIDLIETIKKIVDTINDGIDGNAATKDEQAAREALRKTIASTVGVLLKEDEIMQELVKRGMTNEEFIRNAEEEIRRSQEAVADLTPLRDEQKELLNSFGKTIYLETSKSYMSKSKLDELKHDKEALVKLQQIEEALQKLHELQDGASTMDPSSTDYANNKKAMEVLLGNVKGAVKDLKALGLHTAPSTSTELTKTLDIDFSYLEKLDVNGDFIAAKTTTAEIAHGTTGPNKSIEELIELDYASIKEVMKKDFAKFGFANEAEVDALTYDEVDAKIKNVEDKIKKYDDQIQYEEAYQAQTKESMEKFKAKTDREKELAGKFQRVTVKKKVKQPKLKPDGTPELDADGKPVMEEVEKDVVIEVPTDDARKAYLAAKGISDEDAYRTSKIDEARAGEEAKEAALTRKQKRALIRADYRRDDDWHPIKWFRSQFFTDRMWENEYKRGYLSPKITAAETAAKEAAEQEIATKLKEASSKDLQDKKVLEAEVTYVRNTYLEALKRAASQEKITDELYRGQTDEHVKVGARRAAMSYSLDAVSTAEMLIAVQRRRAGEISETEFNAISANYNATITSRVGTDEKDVHNRAHADNVTNTTKTRRTETPRYIDEDATR